MSLKYRLKKDNWCHCRISSPSAHHDNCINEGCNKYIPNGYQVLSVAEEEVERLEEELEHDRDLIYELGENLKAAEDQNHYYTLMCEYRDKLHVIEKDIKEAAGLLLTSSYTEKENGDMIIDGNESKWIKACAEVLKPYFKRV